MTAPISNGPATTRLHHYAGHYSAISNFEVVTGELHAKLVASAAIRQREGAGRSGPDRVTRMHTMNRRCGERRRGRSLAAYHRPRATSVESAGGAAAWPFITDHAPPVWRAPTGPRPGRASSRRAERRSRRGRRAGGRTRRRQEHRWRSQQEHRWRSQQQHRRSSHGLVDRRLGPGTFVRYRARNRSRRQSSETGVTP